MSVTNIFKPKKLYLDNLKMQKSVKSVLYFLIFTYFIKILYFFQTREQHLEGGPQCFTTLNLHSHAMFYNYSSIRVNPQRSPYTPNKEKQMCSYQFLLSMCNISFECNIETVSFRADLTQSASGHRLERKPKK